MNTETRRKGIKEAIDDHELQDPDNGEYTIEEAKRYLLIEQNYRYGMEYWITGHDTPEQAANYHDTQEYAEDWRIDVLIDLDTRKQYEGTSTTTWTETTQ